MLVTFLLALVVFLALTFLGRGFFGWAGAAAVWLVGWRLTGIASPLLFDATALLLTVLAVLFGVPPIRRAAITRFSTTPVDWVAAASEPASGPVRPKHGTSSPLARRGR